MNQNIYIKNFFKLLSINSISGTNLSIGVKRVYLSRKVFSFFFPPKKKRIKGELNSSPVSLS